MTPESIKQEISDKIEHMSENIQSAELTIRYKTSAGHDADMILMIVHNEK